MKSCLKSILKWIIIIALSIVIYNAWIINIAKPWSYILEVIVFTLLICIVDFIFIYISCFKDPDVMAASDLRMDVRRYRKYREWYDEYSRLMSQYGIDSPEANEYFKSIFPKIKNPNEWRRYQNYRYEEWKKETRKKFDELFKDRSEKSNTNDAPPL